MTDYLELRQQLKAAIRKRMKAETVDSVTNSQQKKEVSCDGYGSFFGPWQPVIAPRLIQESKSLDPALVLRALDSHRKNKRSSPSSSARTTAAKKPKLTTNELKLLKVQRLKESRDFSFLFSTDTQLPAPLKEPALQCVSVPNSGPESKQPLKSISSDGGMHGKAGSHKPSTSFSEPSGTVAAQPGVPKDLHSKATVTAAVKKAPVPIIVKLKINSPTGTQKLPSSAPKQHLEQKKGVMSKHAAAVANSRPEMNKPVRRSSSHAGLQDHRPRRRRRPGRWYSDDEEEDDHIAKDVMAICMIRKMFNTQRFAGRDDKDRAMEANYQDILKEERLSSRLARKEDEEQFHLIKKEERRDRMRKLAKK